MLVSNCKCSLFVLLVILSFASFSFSEPSLRLVQVIYRHGDRSPTKTYPTDPYQEDAWPQGFGQLTLRGINQAYELGQFLRNRYNETLNSTYIRSEIYVRSSDKDRTLMTASAVLWGLFPAHGSQVWKTGSTWQPIPVHTVPLKDDLLIYTHCPTFEKLYEELLASDHGMEIEHSHKELIEYVAKHSQTKPKLMDLLDITNPLFCEKEHNMKLPQWLMEYNTFEKIMVFYNIKAQLKAKTTALMRIKAGVLLGEMLQNINDYVKYKNMTQKMFMYSAHDTNVAAALNALQVFDGQHPQYCACLMLELHEMADNSFGIRLYYRKKTNEKPLPLKIPGCSSLVCSLSEFAAVVKDLIPEDPKAECFGNPHLFTSLSSSDTIMATVSLFSLSFLMLTVTVTLLIREWITRKRKFRYRIVRSNV